MPRSRRSTLLLTVATLALPVALGACSSLGTTPLEAGIRSPSGGTIEPVGEAAKVDAGRLTRIAKATEAAGDLANAATMYQRAVALDPESTEALLALAHLYRRLGVPENAEKAYRSVISREPGNRDARRGLGNALIALERPGEALVEFERLIAADPLDPRGYNGRGVALSMQGRYEEARESFETGLRLAPDDVQLNNNLALSLAMSGQPGEAVPILKRLSSNPNAPQRVHKNLALAERSASRGKVHVTDLGPPSEQDQPSDVLYTAPEAADEAPAAPAEPVEPAKPAATSDIKPVVLAPQSLDDIDVRQFASLIETLDPPAPTDTSPDASDVPVSAAEPAAGASATTSETDAGRAIEAVAQSDAPTKSEAVAPVPDAGSIERHRTAPPAKVATARTAGIQASVVAPPAATAVPAKTARMIAPARGTPAPNAELASQSKTIGRPAEPKIAATAGLPQVAPSAGAARAAAAPQASAPAPTNDPAPGFAGYRVQLAAESSSELAFERWGAVAESAGDLLDGFSPHISVAPETKNRPLYRLRTSPMMSQAEARSLCDALASREIPCYLAAVRGGAVAEAGETAAIAPAAGGKTPGEAESDASAAEAAPQMPYAF